MKSAIDGDLNFDFIVSPVSWLMYEYVFLNILSSKIPAKRKKAYYNNIYINFVKVPLDSLFFSSIWFLFFPLSIFQKKNN